MGIGGNILAEMKMMQEKRTSVLPKVSLNHAWVNGYMHECGCVQTCAHLEYICVYLCVWFWVRFKRDFFVKSRKLLIPQDEDKDRDERKENPSSSLLAGVRLRSTGLADSLKSPTNGFPRGSSGSKSPNCNRDSVIENAGIDGWFLVLFCSCVCDWLIIKSF